MEGLRGFWLLFETVSGAMFYIGNGPDYPPLHTQAYDFNDRILPTAIRMLAGLALDKDR